MLKYSIGKHRRYEDEDETIQFSIWEQYDTEQENLSRIIASCHLKKLYGNHRSIEEVYVQPSYRKQGFGSRLLEMVKDYAVDHFLVLQLTAVPIDDNIDEDSLIYFYMKSGFRFIGSDNKCRPMLDYRSVYEMRSAENNNHLRIR